MSLRTNNGINNDPSSMSQEWKRTSSPNYQNLFTSNMRRKSHVGGLLINCMRFALQFGEVFRRRMGEGKIIQFCLSHQGRLLKQEVIKFAVQIFQKQNSRQWWSNEANKIASRAWWSSSCKFGSHLGDDDETDRFGLNEIGKKFLKDKISGWILLNDRTQLVRTIKRAF